VRRIVVLLVVAGGALLCACGTTKVVTGTVAPGPTASGPKPSSLQTLGLALEASAKAITSEHFNFSSVAPGGEVSGHGDQSLTEGRSTAADLTENVSSTSIRVLDVDGIMYAHLPTTTLTGGKPWAQIDSTASTVTLRNIYSSARSVEFTTGPSVASTYAAAATSTSAGVAEPINGRPATHYAMIVDTTQLPGAVSGDPTDAHVDVWIDDLNRPVKLILKATITGQLVQTTVTSGNFNAPVTVSAPPAAQVSH
jgi:hypothetical protein